MPWFLSHRPLSRDLQGKHLLSDPDLLIRIAENIRTNPVDTVAIQEFGLVLSDVRMGGTWKRTGPGRLRGTERVLCEHLKPISGVCISVLDIGASEGITTVELAEALGKRFQNEIRVTLADLHLWLDRYKKGPIVEFRARDGEAILVKCGRLGLRVSLPRRASRDRPHRLVNTYLKANFFRNLLKFDRAISLVHPLALEHPAIKLKELDCLIHDPALIGQFSAVRASNVLNLEYFGISQLNVALANLHSYLAEDGLLVISRNADTPKGEIENGSLWRKAISGFRHVCDLGTGSEISSVVEHPTP